MEKILPIIIIIIISVLFLIYTLFIFSSYHRCPADKLMVIYGRVGNDKNGEPRGFVCIHGGGAFVWPIIQRYQYFDLKPIKVEVNLKNTLSKNNVFVEIDAVFTISISNEDGVRQSAVERLLGLSQEEIHDLTKNILIGTLRLMIKNMNIKEIDLKSDQFTLEVFRKTEDELKKIGLKPFGINIERINKLGGVTKKQDPMSITGQKLVDGQINKIEQDNECIVIYLNKKPDVNIIIKCNDYISYELLGKLDNFIVSDIFINDSRDLIDKSIQKVKTFDNVDSKNYNITNYNWQQINIRLFDGAKIKVACKTIEVYC